MDHVVVSGQAQVVPVPQNQLCVCFNRFQDPTATPEEELHPVVMRQLDRSGSS